MLQKINGHTNRACRLLKDADPREFFPRTLEFSPPARGTWNIVHTGLQLPEAHQIYICASGCLRGVILTAAERGAMNRFSTIELLEKDLVRSDNERLIINGVTDILQGLPKLPPAVLIFTACFHHFMGTDLTYVYQELRRRFPGTDFAECIMDPIRQTRSITPEERLRREIYRLWRPRPQESRTCNILSGNLPTDATSELTQLLQTNGWTVRDMTTCHSYAEFQQMAASCFNIYCNPFGHKAARDLKQRLGQDYLFLPQYWRYDEILNNLSQLTARIHVPLPDYRPRIAECELALDALHEQLGDTPIALDYTLTFAPFSLARLLCEHGFQVCRIYADGVTPEDRADFDWLEQTHGGIELWSTKNPDERVTPRGTSGKILCLGQKAAWFNGSPYFVEFVEGGGHYGFDAILRLIRAMSQAFLIPKDTRQIISRKGFGGPCCL